MPTTIKFRIRRNTTAGWASTNPILDVGEQGLDIDTGSFKIGNGRTRWSALKTYLSSDSMIQAIEEAVAVAVIDTSHAEQALLDHINSSAPHPVYDTDLPFTHPASDSDDGPSFKLLYQNAKV